MLSKLVNIPSRLQQPSASRTAVEALSVLVDKATRRFRVAFSSRAVHPRPSGVTALGSDHRRYSGRTRTNCPADQLGSGGGPAQGYLHLHPSVHRPDRQRPRADASRGSFAGALNATSPQQHGPILLPQLMLESGVRDLVTAAALHAQYRGADGTLQLFADIRASNTVALADRDGSYDEQIDGSLALWPVTPVLAEAPLAGLADSPERRTAVANQLLLDLTHQFAVAELLT
jgi:hypothetical protein